MSYHFVKTNLLVLGLPLFLATYATAQNVKPVTTSPSSKVPLEQTQRTAVTTPAVAAAPLPIHRCETCKHALPVEVHTSAKDAVVFSGPPDGKGAPVEYQVFVQMTPGAAWELGARGEITKPGERHPHCFRNSAQIMVLVWTETPFGSIAEFSDACN